MSRRTGAVGALYINDTDVSSTDWSDTGWTVVASVKDVTLSGDVGQADVSARGSIWRQNVTTLIDGGIELTIPWDDDDTDLDFFREAWLSRAEVAVAALSDTIENSGQGVFGNWYVTKFERSEPLEDAMMASIELKPSSYTAWKNPES